MVQKGATRIVEFSGFENVNVAIVVFPSPSKNVEGQTHPSRPTAEAARQGSTARKKIVVALYDHACGHSDPRSLPGARHSFAVRCGRRSRKSALTRSTGQPEGVCSRKCRRDQFQSELPQRQPDTERCSRPAPLHGDRSITRLTAIPLCRKVRLRSRR